mgnify:CR=1 FL=1
MKTRLNLEAEKAALRAKRDSGQTLTPEEEERLAYRPVTYYQGGNQVRVDGLAPMTPDEWRARIARRNAIARQNADKERDEMERQG